MLLKEKNIKLIRNGYKLDNVTNLQFNWGLYVWDIWKYSHFFVNYLSKQSSGSFLIRFAFTRITGSATRIIKNWHFSRMINKYFTC